MVKRGYFRGASFSVNGNKNTTIVTSAYLANSHWAAHVSLYVDDVEVKQKDFGLFADLADALVAAIKVGSQLANDGNTGWAGL